jgi:hypothetical protein
MTLVVLQEAPGTSASTTSALALAALTPEGQQTLLLECDASGGDVVGWADLAGNPSWSTAVSGADRSWAGMFRHLQRLPSGLHVMAAPTNASRARTAVAEAAERFAPMVASLSDVVAFADCGRATESNGWLRSADLVAVLLRQSPSVGATVARVDRTTEFVASLDRSRSGLVVVGDRPYPPADIAVAVGCELFGVLADDPTGAALASGAWTVGRGAMRTALARSATTLSADLIDRAAHQRAGRHLVESDLEVPA